MGDVRQLLARWSSHGQAGSTSCVFGQGEKVGAVLH